MAGRATAKPGDILSIPLADGWFGYCKVLCGVEIGFYDFRSATEISTEDLSGIDFLFRIWVMKYALKKSSTWKVIGNVLLTGEEARPSRFCKKDALSGALSIYQSAPAGGTAYTETPATFAECKDLECAAVWDPEHVESRLEDHFAGRPNIWVEYFRLKES